MIIAMPLLTVHAVVIDDVVDFLASIESMDIKSCKMYRACKKDLEECMHFKFSNFTLY